MILIHSSDIPLFSVIIPVFNRRTFVERAIRSVRCQPLGTDVEIVVVDDASTDDSFEALQEMTVKYGLVLLRHDINRGIGPTRNTAIAVARGEWIVPLDSDDELAPDALTSLKDIITELPEDIHRIRCMVACDNGQLSPQPAMKEEIWNYEDYLRAVNVPDGTPVESASVFSRASLLAVPYQSGRTSEGLFHLDYFSRFKVRTTALVSRFYHSDSTINTRSASSAEMLLRNANDWAYMVDNILERHGDALKRFAPLSYIRILHCGVRNNFICGNRGRALFLAARCFSKPSLRLAAYLLLGLVGPELMAQTVAWITARK